MGIFDFCNGGNGSLSRTTLKYSFMQSLPVMAGYIVLGTGFGVLLADKGYSFWWAVLMSAAVYAGSLQYVGVSLLAGGASLISTALMSLMVNARHLFYGISMLKKYREMDGRRFYAIFALTDETYSLVCKAEVPDGVDLHSYYFFLSLMNQSYWIFGSFLGAFLGNTLEFNWAGIDFSMTALFVVMFVEQWEKADNHLPAVAGVAVSVICLLIFGAEYFLIPSMVFIALALLLMRRPSDKRERRRCHD